jgi:hypothetical protein
MSIHPEPFEGAGKTFTLPDGSEFRVEDWWDRVAGRSWQVATGNPAALEYGMRSGLTGLPLDDEVVYGKNEGGFGHLVHVSELDGGASA